MRYFPESIRKLIEHLDTLPGIGPKHAVRLALYLLNNKTWATQFLHDSGRALETIRFCSRCQNVTDRDRCIICSDPHRDQGTICVVAHVQDIEPIERTGKFNGLYHILHGTLNPLEGITPDNIRIQELIQRIQNDGVREVILALDATTEGETTAMYLEKKLASQTTRVTKLARGIPMGSSIEYTDEVTLSSALENRK